MKRRALLKLVTIRFFRATFAGQASPPFGPRVSSANGNENSRARSSQNGAHRETACRLRHQRKKLLKQEVGFLARKKRNADRRLCFITEINASLCNERSGAFRTFTSNVNRGFGTPEHRLFQTGGLRLWGRTILGRDQPGASRESRTTRATARKAEALRNCVKMHHPQHSQSEQKHRGRKNSRQRPRRGS